MIEEVDEGKEAKGGDFTYTPLRTLRRTIPWNLNKKIMCIFLGFL